MKILKGDSVKVVSGKDKGKVGKVLKIYEDSARVLVENINQYKRHLKKRSESENSQIVTITKPLPVSNVMLVCPKCNKVTRVGYQIEKGKKTRVCKKCGKAIKA